MNFLAICLHCLDMRDFHSHLRDTPYLDELRRRSIFIPMGRGQGHHQNDSLNAEITGKWTARFCDSELSTEGFRSPKSYWLPKTVLEYLSEAGYDLFTCMGFGKDNTGTAAVSVGMRKHWLAGEPDRLAQFSNPPKLGLEELVELMHQSKRFYAHVFLRDTHRPWGQPEGLGALVGKATPRGWPEDAFCARKAALDHPDAFAALRRRGLEKSDSIVADLFEKTKGIDDLVYLVYSNHGEVFDHFRYHLPYRNDGSNMIRGTSHGPFPYEVLYANMQMWLVPGRQPKVMRGIGRSIDIAPTVLSLASVDAADLDGESLLGYYPEGIFPPRRRFAESGHGGCISMVREDGCKLVSTGKLGGDASDPEHYGPAYHRLAVFDLTTDPYEYVNLIDTPQGQDMLRWAIAEHRALKEPC